jgi:hypothetical protein
MTSIKEVKIENLTRLFETFDNGNLGLYGATYLLEDFCKRYTTVKQRDVSYEIKVIEKLQIPDELKKKEIERIASESMITLTETEKRDFGAKINLLKDVLKISLSTNSIEEKEQYSKEEIGEILEKCQNRRAELKRKLIEIAYQKTQK